MKRQDHHASGSRTSWGEGLDTALPLNDYPRPQFVRPRWLNLNGRWEYEVSREEAAPQQYSQTILVPFSPEAPLSGAKRGPGEWETAWYRRFFSLPERFMQDRLLLHFGAVDQSCEVYVNGQKVGGHTGGYLPFTLDITEPLRPEGENSIVVAVRDQTESGVGAYGKQSTAPGGIWYTAQSGIWQTVWLESVPEEYLRELRITPLPAQEQVLLESPEGAGTAFAVFAGSKRVTTGVLDDEGRALVDLPGCTLWTPEAPFLYHLLLKKGRDLVKSYFAMRQLSREGGRLLLNGRPIRLTGLLDQGYWPESLYTAPSDEAMVYDIETARSLGFNLLRKHVKVEPLRWYYHCDRLGMLVWQDIPNGGDSYSTLWTRDLPLFLGLQLSDKAHSRYGRRYERGRKRFEEETEELVSCLYNSPCIVVWSLFNEGWGQFDTQRLTARLKRLDTQRLVDSASGWHDQHCGDFCSRHVYFRRPRLKADSRVQAITECGGYGLRIAGHTEFPAGFSYKKAASGAELTDMLEQLYRQELKPLQSKGLQVCIYTQLSDVEGELNGLLTWDRKVLKVDAARILALNEAWKATEERS